MEFTPTVSQEQLVKIRRDLHRHAESGFLSSGPRVIWLNISRLLDVKFILVRKSWIAPS